MRLEDLNWNDVEEYLKNDDRIILILGACEQHGSLSLLTDVKIPLALADAASRQKNVLIAPPLNFGVSPYFLAFPGTISLSSDTFLQVVEDIVRSLYQQGFRRFLVLNGHGGNAAASQKLVELANELPGMKSAWYAWWLSHSIENIAQKHQLKPYHASWSENFSFVRTGEVPQGEKQPVAFKGLHNAVETRELLGDGVFGGPYQVSDEIMNEIFSEALKDILYLLEF